MLYKGFFSLPDVFSFFVFFLSALLASRKHHLCLVVSVKFVERMRPEVMVFPLLRLGNSSQSLPASPGWICMHKCIFYIKEIALSHCLWVT